MNRLTTGELCPTSKSKLGTSTNETQQHIVSVKHVFDPLLRHKNIDNPNPNMGGGVVGGIPSVILPCPAKCLANSAQVTFTVIEGDGEKYSFTMARTWRDCPSATTHCGVQITFHSVRCFDGTANLIHNMVKIALKEMFEMFEMQ